MNVAATRLICERCGTEFDCSRDNIAACWCNAEPYRLPMPAVLNAGGGCLCPTCLRALAERAAAASGKT